MHISSKKQEAIQLRNEGYSYAFISAKMGVAKSTLSLWLKGVSFMPNEYTRGIIVHGQKQIQEIKRADKAMSIRKALEFAETNFSKLSERDMFLLGIGLYIGEGSKSHNSIRVANADPRIIMFMIKWFKVCFGLKDLNFKIRIHAYPDHNEKEIVNFWMKKLGLRKDAFHPIYVDQRLNKNKKKANVLPYGTAHLCVVSNGDISLGVLLHRKILASIDRVLQ